MRNTRGLMMDAVGARPEDLPRAQWHVVQAALPHPEHPKRAPLPLMPAARALSVQSLMTHLATRQTARAMQAVALLPALLDPRTAAEGLSFATALWQQWQSLQAQWLEGVSELAEEMGEIRHVNTVSKFADQEADLMQQSMALVTAQATATIRLVENLQVNVDWWLSQRATPA